MKTNLFLNFNQKCLFLTKFKSYKRSGESYNIIFYNIFGYVRFVPDDFESNKRLNLISVILISGVHCIIYPRGELHIIIIIIIIIIITIIIIF